MQLALVILCLAGCQNSETPRDPDLPQPSVRDLMIYKIENPASWLESTDRTIVNEIGFAYGEEFYFFYLTTLGQKQTQVIGRTEYGSIRRDFTTGGSPSLHINDMITLVTPLGHPAYINVGGVDQENTYASNNDLDRFSLSSTPAVDVSSSVDFRDYRTQFSSICRAHFLGEPLIDGDNFFIAGNAYDDSNTLHPFVVTYNNTRITNPYDSITTVTFFDDQIDIEFLKIIYNPDKGLYVFGYDLNAQEIVVTLYEDVDSDGDHVHEKKDSFKKVWETRLTLMIDRQLFNVGGFSDRFFIAGTVQTDKDDTAGKIITLDALNGDIEQDTVLDLSDDNDGFYGITNSGANLFAYGYANKVLSGNTSVTSKGWALKLSASGKPMTNHIYEAEDAVIEFTTASGGYEQRSFNEYGYLAIGGSKKTSAGFIAFATQLYHNYK